MALLLGARFLGRHLNHLDVVNTTVILILLDSTGYSSRIGRVVRVVGGHAHWAFLNVALVI